MAPAASDGAVNAFDIDFQAEITVEERESQGSFNRLKGSPGARKATLSFKCDMGWDGSSHPQWASVLLPACGVVATGDVYAPVSAPPDVDGVTTVTITFYLNGIKKTMFGCMGNFKFVATAGTMGTIEWTFEGQWDPVVDEAIIDPTYPQDLPPRFASQSCTWNSTNLLIESVDFDCGNELVLREDASTDSGFLTAIVTDRYPKVNVNPEARLVADDDHFGDWLSADEYQLTFGFTGPAGDSSDGSIVVSAPKAQILNCQAGDRGKLATNDIEFGLNKNGQTEDQEFSITFTDKAD